jgi:hypothetical protein
MDIFECFHENESKYFGEHYLPVIDAITKANVLCYEMVKEAQAKAKGQIDNVLWMLAASCLAEFDDIFLLAGNGRGVGAIKLLRAYYERVVTLSYLAKHPDKVKQFVDYSDVHWKKLLLETIRTKAKVSISKEAVERIETNFEAVKGNYQTRCGKCNVPSLQGSWTKKPVADMASDISDILRYMAFNAYLRPTFHIHTTHFGIVEQCEKTDGKLLFSDVSMQRKMAAEVLNHAHILLGQVMDVLNNKFELAKDEEMKAMGEGWKNSWEACGWPQALPEMPGPPPQTEL